MFNTIIPDIPISKLSKNKGTHHKCQEGQGRSSRYSLMETVNSVSWSTNPTTAAKKAQQHLHFMRVFTKKNLNVKLLVGLLPLHNRTASQCGTPTAQRQTKRLFKGSKTQHRKSFAALCPQISPTSANFPEQKAR